MLQVKNINVIHKKDLRELVTALTFALEPGDKAAVIGEEGNGKSTLLKLLYNPQELDYIEYTGDIIKNQQICGYLAQEMPKEDREKEIYEYLLEEPAFLDMDYRELALLAKKFRMDTELFYSSRKLDTLSGGEKVKLQLLRMLCRKPELLFLDEPSNDLDLQTLEWLEEFIREWKGIVLFISHDETLLENTANAILHLEQTKRKTEPRWTFVRVGYAEYVRRRQAHLERQTMLAGEEKREYQKQQERFLRIQQKVEYQQRIITRQNPSGGRLLKKKMHAVKALERRIEREQENRTQIPDTEEGIFFLLSEQAGIPAGKQVLNYERKMLQAGERVLAEDIRLQVTGPQKVCIIGRNGMGKTTLLRDIAKELLTRRDIRAAYMPQNYEEQLELDSTPVEYLSRTGHRDEHTRIRTYLGSMKFTADEMEHTVKELSGGQKAKLFLLKMSMDEANVLLLDEPTRNLSAMSNPVIRRILREFPGAVISISHDRKYIREVCDVVYELTAEGLRLNDE